MAKTNHPRPRKPRTVQEKKNAIKPWKAKFDGVCDKCKRDYGAGSLVCRAPKPFESCIIHFFCHPDWRPGKLG
jgi:hypothetical protein